MLSGHSIVKKKLEKDQGNPFVNFEKTPSAGVAFISDRA
jgi:hypothetical protein